MTISGHKTRAVFERYNIVDQRDIRQAVERLEPSQNQARTSQFGHVTGMIHRKPIPSREEDRLKTRSSYGFCGARGRNRTVTTFESRDFKSRASASFATRAGDVEVNISVQCMQAGRWKWMTRLLLAGKQSVPDSFESWDARRTALRKIVDEQPIVSGEAWEWHEWAISVSLAYLW